MSPFSDRSFQRPLMHHSGYKLEVLIHVQTFLSVALSGFWPDTTVSESHCFGPRSHRHLFSIHAAIISNKSYYFNIRQTRSGVNAPQVFALEASTGPATG